jgi:putative ABC transport system permease protein
MKVLVNESFFRRLNYRQASDVVGKKIKFGGLNWKTVVGVVKNYNLSSLKDEVGPLLIGPSRATYKNIANNFRSHNIKASENEIRKLWLQFYPSYAFNAGFFEDAIQGFYKQDRELGSLFKIFAGLAIFISCIGLYGMIAYMSTQKRKEVGIRKCWAHD